MSISELHTLLSRGEICVANFTTSPLLRMLQVRLGILGQKFISALDLK